MSGETFSFLQRFLCTPVGQQVKLCICENVINFTKGNPLKDAIDAMAYVSVF